MQMKSIAEFFRNILSGNSEITYKDKILKHRLHILYRGALVFVLIFVIIAFVRIQVNNRVYSEYEVIGESAREGTENSIYENYYGNLLVYSKDGIMAIDKKEQSFGTSLMKCRIPL